MTYQVLARKWRSKNFAQVVGQDHVVRALTNALQTGRLHHAYLFTGTRGVGKTSLARILAKSLNCEVGMTDTPCGTCNACQQIDTGRFVDLLEIDAASNTGIDNIREVLENAQYAPTAGRFKVYIIDEVHMLSKSAFNAMLKTLEEPPAHVKFILATTDPQKVPVTVLSRCLQFNLKQIPPSVVSEHLAHVLTAENITFQNSALIQIGQAAQGSMRDALSLLDQAIAYGLGNVTVDAVQGMLGTVENTHLFNVLNAVCEGAGSAAIREAQEMQARSINFDQALQSLALILHQTALAQTVPAAIDNTSPDYDHLIKLAKRIPPAHVQLYYQIAIHGRKELELAPDEYAGFTMAIMRMLAFKPANYLPETILPTAQAVSSDVTSKSEVTVTPTHSAVITSSEEPSDISSPPAAPWEDNAPTTENVPVVDSSNSVPNETITIDQMAEVNSSSEVLEAVSISAEDIQEVTNPESGQAPQPEAPVQIPELALENAEDWQQIVNELNLSGMASMLAKHMSLISRNDEEWTFKLPANQQPLRLQEEKVKESLWAWLGKKVIIRIELGESEGPAPIHLEAKAKAERLEAATQAILTDPVVSFLAEHAGARLIDDSVTPIG
ncbi:DNA polymerase III subunit gamma/tau [Leeia sp. TBRC 13508]|uniref:DNA polymerase III subunit gamma/tau n=1 Tax=Leeia speluncae TaxID=2884804 RepID=A0ABS8D2M5_9NEIS|nr:DNA polymerase III subunit gamma/tau [Leeia speluncae]MCB6182434.1 DNA polymerase III subunit gamma/tau [Leeia speluncae]